MSYDGTSNPHGGASAVPAKWEARIATMNRADAQAIVAAYQQYSGEVHYSADLALAQGLLETGTFTSPAWLKRYNPAGLGITADNVAGPDFHEIARGVQAHLALLNCYFGDGTDPWGVLTSVGFGGFTRNFTHLNQMNGVWAVPGPTYGEEIAAIANEVVGATPPPPALVVTGAQVLALARNFIGQSWWSGEDGNPPHPSAFWCEAFAEHVPRWFGLPIGRWPTAAAAGRGHTLNTTDAPVQGAWLFFDERFDPRGGHVGFWDADKQMLLCTLTVPAPDGTIGYHATWGPGTVGYMGWCLPDGVTVAPPVEDYLHINGHTIGGGFKRLFTSTPFAMQAFGLPTSDEMQAQVTDPAADGTDAHAVTKTRTVQFFERCIMIYSQELAEPWDVACCPINSLVAT